MLWTPSKIFNPSSLETGGTLIQNPEYAVAANNIGKIYEVPSGNIQVLKNINFNVLRGEIVAIVGESGSGKSTLLHLLGALDRPNEGSLLVGGVNPFQNNDEALSVFRNKHVGFVFQHNNLLPEFSALENVMMPALISVGKNKIYKNEKTLSERALYLLTLVGLQKRSEHFPGQLSGGEQQRVAIARALINNPDLLLADEPSGNLDSTNATNVHGLFQSLNRELGTTVIIVTHNAHFASSLPRQIELKDGRIISDCKLR
jgi:ABC-type lipoprotein export system ATPase subunit